MKKFPIGRPYTKGFLQVSNIHSIYYECYGNPKGKPVIILHGGPGSSLGNKKNKLFNPRKWNIVHFDQRGCGKSLPIGELYENTTMHLVEDIKKLMYHLNHKKFLILGGSWGSTLALAYALKYPKTVTGLVLSAIWLGTKEETDYMYYGAAQFYPDAVEDLLHHFSDKEKSDIVLALYHKVISKDLKLANKFAKITQEFEATIGDLKKNKTKRDILSSSKICLHYESNNCFLPNNYILKHASRLNTKPVTIVHGRHDILCKPIVAYTLHKAIKSSTIHFVPKTSHGASKSSLEVLQNEIKLMEKLAK